MDIVKLYSEGKSIQTIAKVCGLRKYAIVKELASKGVKLRRSNRGKNADCGKIVSLYQSGKTLKEISLSTGIAKSTVQWRLVSAGVTLRPSWWKRKIDFDKAVSLYCSGLTITEVAKILGASDVGVGDLLRKAGIRTGIERNTEIKYQNQKENILKDYDEGKSINHLREKYNMDFETLKSLIKRWRGRVRMRVSKYKFNENYFSGEKLGEKQSYFLGFILGDGCNIRDHKLSITLNSKDRGLLEEFNKELQTEKKITEIINDRGVGTCYFSVSSSILMKDLIHYGIVQRKSRVAEFKNINYLSNVALWRGEIDADGWYSIDEKRQSVSLCGSEKIINQFKEFLIYQGIKVTTKIYRKDSIYVLTLNRKVEVAKLIHILYDKSTLSLPRKHKIAMSILGRTEG